MHSLRHRAAKQVVEMCEGRSSHVPGVGNHAVAHVEAVNPVLLPPVRALAMEEGCIGVAVLEERDAGSLAGDGALEGGEAKVGCFNMTAEPILMRG